MDTDPFKNYQPDLFPRLRAVGGWLASHLSVLPQETEMCLTEHRAKDVAYILPPQGEYSSKRDDAGL